LRRDGRGQAAVGGPGVYAGSARLTITRFSKSVADASTGAMSAVRKEDRARQSSKQSAHGGGGGGGGGPLDGAVASGWLEKIVEGKFQRNRHRYFVFNPKSSAGRQGIAYPRHQHPSRNPGLTEDSQRFPLSSRHGHTSRSPPPPCTLPQRAGGRSNRGGGIWVRVEIMGLGKDENVGKSRPVLMMIHPMISTRTRT
jgi:hypothetical protein